jgi:hypothetical protein
MFERWNRGIEVERVVPNALFDVRLPRAFGTTRSELLVPVLGLQTKH